jgi:hypothetical protein
MTIRTFTLTLGLLLGLMIHTAAAQATGGPGSRLAWDQAATNLAEAQGITYEASFDGGALATVAATCTGSTSPFTCVASIPALTPGSHTTAVRAVRIIDSQRLEGPLSATFNFTLVALPAAPTNLRIVSGD